MGLAPAQFRYGEQPGFGRVRAAKRVMTPDGKTAPRNVGWIQKLPKGRPEVGQGLLRLEVQKLLVQRRWPWKILSEEIELKTGKVVRPMIYKLRGGTYAATPDAVDKIIVGFSGHGADGGPGAGLTPVEKQRLHVAAAVDFGFRVGG